MSDDNNIPPRRRVDARKNWLRRQFDRAEENRRPGRLRLSGQGLNFEDAVVVANTMNHYQIRSLRLSDNDFGDKGAKALARTLSVNTTVERIDLRNDCISAVGAVALAGAIARNTCLECFLFSRNSIGDVGVVAFAEALTSNSTLDSISLGSNNATAFGAAKLADAIKARSQLTYVNFEDNDIGDAGGVAFADALAANPFLSELHLPECRIGDSGLVAIAEALAANAHLRTLELGRNNISDVGAAALAEVLKVNSGLITLSLFDNNITAEGATMLLDGLRMNSVLTAVNLQDNDITGAEGARVLAEINATAGLSETLRFFPTIFHRLERGVDNSVAIPHRQDFHFTRERANQLGSLLLQETTVVTELEFPLKANEWTSHDTNNSLSPLLQFIERDGILRNLTYVLRNNLWGGDIIGNARTVLSVIQSFFAAVTNRTAEIDFKLIVDVRWLLNRDNMRVFECLMKNVEYSFLKSLSVVKFYPYYEDIDSAVLDSEQFVTALQVNSTLVSLSLEAEIPCTKLLKAWMGSAHHSTLQTLFLRVNDHSSLLQVFETLPWLVHLQELHLKMLKDDVVKAWHSRQREFLRTLGGNTSLRRVEVLVEGEEETPEQAEWYCHRNKVMPHRMADARAHNPDVARRGGVTGSVPALSCYQKLLHQASSLNGPAAAVGLSWMLCALVELGDAVCVCSSTESTADQAPH